MTSPAPDGGWGWMVVFAYFLISVITDGIRYSFGIMFISLVEAFGKGSGETAWVGGLMTGTCNVIGPIVTKLTDRYGCRLVAVAGSLIASAGFIASVFAQNLYQLYITFGVVSGIGFGMIFLTSIVSVSRYFNKKRALAMGISVCGSGVGAIVFNPLSKWMLDEYGWRGTILIEAGMILNCAALGFLYRPVPQAVTEPCDEKKREENTLPLLEKKEAAVNDLEKSYDHSIGQEYSTYGKKDLVKSVNPEITRVAENSTGLNFEIKVIKRQTAPDGNEIHSDTNEFPLFVRDRKECNDFIDGKNSHISVYETKSNCEQFTSFSIEIFKFSLLKDPSFLIFFLSSFLITVAYNVPYTYLPDLAVKLGYSKSEGVLLISYLGIANTICRIIFGVLGDRQEINRTYLYNVSNITCGLFTIFVPLFSNYGLLIMYAVAFGGLIGGYVSLSTLVAGDLFSIDVITESIGLFMLACGLASFTGTPVAGWLYDLTKSYAISFISTGVLLLLGGAILFIVPCIRRQKKKITL